MSLALLRLQLSEVLDTTKPGTPGLATGLRTLDSALPLGGLPRGRLTEIVGAPGAGKTTVVRQIVERAVRDGWCVAYIDATRTLAPRDWAHINTLNPRAADNLWVVRPDRPDRGAWCADVLLRSSAFALVVLDGAPLLSRNVAVRLTRLAREADSALLALSDDNKASELAGSLRMRVTKTKSQRTTVIIEKGAPYQTVTVGEASRGNEVARRVRTHPEVPDRRGVARKQKREHPNTRTAHTSSRINARSRRAGEPRIPDEPFIAVAGVG